MVSFEAPATLAIGATLARSTPSCRNMSAAVFRILSMRAAACFADGRPGVRVLLDAVELLCLLCIGFVNLPSVTFRRIVDKEELIEPTSSVLFFSRRRKDGHS